MQSEDQSLHVSPEKYSMENQELNKESLNEQEYITQQDIGERDNRIPQNILEKLPQANELLPKLKNEVELPNIALKISVQQLPSFIGIVPQREELYVRVNDKSQQFLNRQIFNEAKAKQSKHEISLGVKRYFQKQFTEENSRSPTKKKRKISQDIQFEAGVKGQKLSEGLKLKGGGMKTDKLKGLGRFEGARGSLPSANSEYNIESKLNEIGNSKLAFIKNGKNTFSQEQRKQKFGTKQQTISQYSSQNRLPSSSLEKFPNQEESLYEERQSSPRVSLKNSYEPNIQKYFLRLNIVFQKYAELKVEYDNSKRDGFFSSNIVEFNSVYCDVRSLIKAQIFNSDGYTKGLQEQQNDFKTPSKELSKQFSEQQKTVSPFKVYEEKTELLPYYQLREKQDKTLIFESRFESGNLAQAAKVSHDQYDLLLQNDINTHGYTQWFFFKVSNTTAGHRVKFNIINLTKPNSLFNQGMKLLVFSRHSNTSENKGWHRSCDHISYSQNRFFRRQALSFQQLDKNNSPSPADEERQHQYQQYQPQKNKSRQIMQKYYTLSFEYQFQHSDDEVYFAYNYPYTYSELQTYLDELENLKFNFLSRRLLCRTLAGNRLDLLTITSPKFTPTKQVIVLSARVHPGETVSSFVMKGIIDFLVGDSKEAVLLRERFVFKIVPMLNPDGVIHGNYRCSLSGNDLNRKWKNPQKSLHPEIFYFKRMILEIADSLKVALFCDLHGHSVKKNIFFYGCHNKEQPLACRELPFLLSKLHAPFSFKDCNFLVQSSKEGTARVALYQSLGIPNIFTLESSFCGPSYDNIHFQKADLETMGSRMCEAFLIYFSSLDCEQNQVTQQQQTLQDLRNTYLSDLWQKDIKELNEIGMEISDGSDSCPSEDDLETKEISKIFDSKKQNPKTIFKSKRNTQNDSSNISTEPKATVRQQSFDNLPISVIKASGQVFSFLGPMKEQFPLQNQNIQQLYQPPASTSYYPTFQSKNNSSSKRMHLFSRGNTSYDDNLIQSTFISGLPENENEERQSQNTSLSRKNKCQANLVTLVALNEGTFGLNNSQEQELNKIQSHPFLPLSKVFIPQKKNFPFILNQVQRPKTPFQICIQGMSAETSKYMNSNKQGHSSNHSFAKFSQQIVKGSTINYQTYDTSSIPPLNNSSSYIIDKAMANSIDVSLLNISKIKDQDHSKVPGAKGFQKKRSFRVVETEGSDNSAIKKVILLKGSRDQSDNPKSCKNDIKIEQFNEKEDYNYDYEDAYQKWKKREVLPQKQQKEFSETQQMWVKERYKTAQFGREKISPSLKEQNQNLIGSRDLKEDNDSQVIAQTMNNRQRENKFKKQSQNQKMPTEYLYKLDDPSDQTKKDFLSAFSYKKKQKMEAFNPLTVKTIRYSKDFSAQASSEKLNSVTSNELINEKETKKQTKGGHYNPMTNNSIVEKQRTTNQSYKKKRNKPNCSNQSLDQDDSLNFELGGQIKIEESNWELRGNTKELTNASCMNLRNEKIGNNSNQKGKQEDKEADQEFKIKSQTIEISLNSNDQAKNNIFHNSKTVEVQPKYYSPLCSEFQNKCQYYYNSETEIGTQKSKQVNQTSIFVTEKEQEDTHKGNKSFNQESKYQLFETWKLKGERRKQLIAKIPNTNQQETQSTLVSEDIIKQHSKSLSNNEQVLEKFK